MQGYFFHTNNPYRDWPSAFAEGQERAREGDLNTAVLLLEAAILQDPQDSEVKLAERQHLYRFRFIRAAVSRGLAFKCVNVL